MLIADQAAKGFTKGVKAKQITPQGLPEKPPHAGPRGGCWALLFCRKLVKLWVDDAMF